MCIPSLERNSAFVLEQLKLEEGRFARTLKQGNKEFDKVASRVENGTLRRLERLPPVRHLWLPH